MFCPQLILHFYRVGRTSFLSLFVFQFFPSVLLELPLEGQVPPLSMWSSM